PSSSRTCASYPSRRWKRRFEYRCHSRSRSRSLLPATYNDCGPMRRHVLPIVLLSLALLVEGTTGQSSGGTIAGHVTLTKRVRGSPLPSTAYPARAIGHRESPSVPEIRNVVVYVKDA